MAAMGEGTMTGTLTTTLTQNLLNSTGAEIGYLPTIQPVAVSTMPPQIVGGPIMREGFISGTGLLTSGKVPIAPFGLGGSSPSGQESINGPAHL